MVQNDGYDIKTASAGPDAIVYDKFGSIYLLDLKSNKPKKLEITVEGDVTAVRPRYQKVANRIGYYALSPTGARAVFGARGEILTVPAEKGNARDLTNTRELLNEIRMVSGRQMDRLFFRRVG